MEESAAEPNDVLDLNVGGQKLSVLRQTLTCVPGSMLESLFSGRWDAARLAMDKDGNFFIDQPFELFEAMINFLRVKSLERPGSNAILSPDFKDHPPAKQQHFRKMVEYYGMTSTIFPARLSVYRAEDFDFTSSGDLRVESRELTTFKVQPKGHEREICGFEVTFDKAVESIQVIWTRSFSNEGNVSLRYSSSVFDVEFEGASIGKIAHVPSDETVVVVRCEAFGNRWYVNGKLAHQLVTGILQRSPTILAKGAFYVSNPVYYEKR
jgi:hypothetical protein